MSTWIERLEPLLQKYRGRKHPLEYKNRYQLMVMVMLSAQDSDRHINQISTALFEAYPTLSELAKATPQDLERHIGGVTNFPNKVKWLIKTATEVGSDDAIPHTLDELVKLSGIGRKSANVIIRESGGPAEGIIVDLHVVRVAPRIGIAEGDKAEKIEKQLMAAIPAEHWGEIGMAISFLGREICRPQPKCGECPVNQICAYRKAHS